MKRAKMQQLRRLRRTAMLAAAVMLVGGGIFLITREIPAPQSVIEKPLDAQKFLKQ